MNTITQKNKLHAFSTVYKDLYIIYVLSCIYLWSGSSVSCAQTRLPDRSAGKELCFVSDTQEPNFFEKLFMHPNNNSKARQAIFAGILDEKPSAVFHLGDLVEFGSWPGDWGYIDDFVNRLHSRGIAFNAVPGNHEYMLLPGQGIGRFTKRFSEFSLTGYLRISGNCAVVLLNSNFSSLSAEEILRQKEWYKKTLHDLDNNPGIAFIIVACHHSPYTNSKIVSPSMEVRNQFLSEFFNGRKCTLFLSGHAHAYEHFKISGKDFLVIGGGGGISQPLFAGNEMRSPDLADENHGKGRFHFLSVETGKKRMRAVLMALDDDMKKVRASDTVIVYVK